MFIATISILGITVFVWLANRVLAFRVCPICAGVAGTWLWMLAARLLGYEIDPIALALLMGGSVVGIAYQIEKRLSQSRSPLLWKTLFIPTGFIGAYGLLMQWWGVLLVSLTFLALVVYAFLSTHKNAQKGVIKELEEKMKNCC